MYKYIYIYINIYIYIYIYVCICIKYKVYRFNCFLRSTYILTTFSILRLYYVYVYICMNVNIYFHCAISPPRKMLKQKHIIPGK